MTAVLEQLRTAAVIAVLRAPDAAGALRAVDALVAGGVTGIEVTYSTPDAPAVIETLAGRYGDRIVLGAGTVRTPAEATAAVDAGATYLVSPGSTDELAEAMLRTGATVLLGALTPSEVMAVSGLGAHAVKIFPASLGGPAYLRALRAPFPELAFVPTGSVRPDNIGEWLDAGAVAAGAGGELCSAKDIATGRFDRITEHATRFTAAVTAWRER